MQVVAGLSLKNLEPRIWDPRSPYYLESLQGVMVSYAEFAQRQRCSQETRPEPAVVNSPRRRQAMEKGLRTFLDMPEHVRIYLDNGAFYFSSRGITTDVAQYARFVEAALPDWRPVAQDFIPLPGMPTEEQRECLRRTMGINRECRHDDYVPVIHICSLLTEYLQELTADSALAAKQAIALGGLVPNLLRAPKAMGYNKIIEGIRQVRDALDGKLLHIFGVGGTATLHLAALLGIDSVDSCGWRNRAARGIVQLAGCGDRSVVKMGSWRGREPSKEEWARLIECGCPACHQWGMMGLKADKALGFRHRAGHNLWVLLDEARWIEEQFRAGTYMANYRGRLDNSVYLPLIERVVDAVGLPMAEALGTPPTAPDARAT